jgi:uncharacterized protein YabE (DUF348 family)
LLLILIAVFSFILGGSLYVLTAAPVTLTIEDVTQRVRTHQRTVEGLLGELGLLVDPEDVVAPSLDAALAPGMVVMIDKAEPIALDVDGRRVRWRTHLIAPRDILAQAGVAVSPEDRVVVDGVTLTDQTFAAPPRHIQVVRAIRVAIIDAGVPTTLLTSARTVGAALETANIPLYLADRITPGTDALLAEGDTITIQRSVEVYVEVDGMVLRTRTHGKTVAEALAEIGLIPVGLDVVIPDEAAAVTPDMTIRVIRVGEREVVERDALPFPQATRIDPALSPGETRLEQPGAEGLQERRVRVRREDGLETARTTPVVTILRTPQAEIAAVGPTHTPTLTPTLTPTVVVKP